MEKNRKEAAREIIECDEQMGLSVLGDREVVLNKTAEQLQGLCHSVNRRKVKYLIRARGINILCLQETKCVDWKKFWEKSIWDNDQVGWLIQNSDGLSGGLIMAWDSLCFQYLGLASGRTWKWVQFKCSLTNDIFHVVNVYGPLNLKGKRKLWPEISEILLIAGNDLVCVVGDFNSIMDERESVNCTYRRLDVQGFKAFIRINNLCEIGMVNENFTWFGPFGRCSKLDRFLVNDNWFANDCLEVFALNKMISDHRLILLYVSKYTKDPVPFRAFNWWLYDVHARVEMENFWKQGK
ncbi:uncharacterized protein LOC141714089 [Apium graveolens]|uniref:uncharacterized protein LOC141714089 n=1 Tax=Apium graveolens TaxID=4045 RepID=UPI003D7943ED